MGIKEESIEKPVIFLSKSADSKTTIVFLKSLITGSILCSFFSVMAWRKSTDSTIVKSNSNPGSANVSEAENELNGTWKQSCGGDLDSSGAVKNFNTTEATYSDSKVNGKSTIYLDDECKDKALLMVLTGVMDSGKILMQPAGAKNFDVTVSEIQITISNLKTCKPLV